MNLESFDIMNELGNYVNYNHRYIRSPPWIINRISAIYKILRR